MLNTKNISALILAAGQSKRMNQSKIVLPWGKSTIIAHIISIFKSAGVADVLVVTGGYRDLVETEVIKAGGRTVFNPDFMNEEMSISLKVGLENLEKNTDAIFLALGDQPNVFVEDIQKLIAVMAKFPQKIIVPSYDMHRGHPWLVPQTYFEQLKAISPPDTLRSFLKRNEKNIEYLCVNHPEILLDLDTPQDYKDQLPKS
jgi:molybdenum cofactor cytidylyltransferase